MNRRTPVHPHTPLFPPLRRASSITSAHRRIMLATAVLRMAALSLILSLANPAARAEFPLCTASNSQEYPSVGGRIAVWQDTRNSTFSDIYAYDFTTGAEFPVSTASGYQKYPSISDGIIVWQHSDDIYGYDLAAGEHFPICTASGKQERPRISGNIVVWQDYRYTFSYDIFGYDLAARVEFPICTEAEHQTSPVVSGNIVVWVHGSVWGRQDIYAYNIETGTKFPICTDSAQQTWPSISGDIVVWMDQRNGPKFGIYGYDLSTQREFLICNAPNDQRYPVVSGDIVVWQDERNGTSSDDIYGYSLKSGTEFPICTAPGQQEWPYISDGLVVWQDERGAPGSYDIYAMHLKNTCTASTIHNRLVEDVPVSGTTLPASQDDISYCGYNDSRHVWYWYAPEKGGTVRIDTDGSTFDTTLSVYLACGGPELACNDDYSLHNTQSRVTLDVVAGKTYHIRLAGFNQQTGDYNLTITRPGCIDRPQSDANGDCKVDFADLAIFANQWLNCGLANQQACYPH